MPHTSEDDKRLMGIWVALAVVIGVFFGVGGGVLAWMAGQVVPEAVLTGCAAFGGTVAVALLIINALK